MAGYAITIATSAPVVPSKGVNNKISSAGPRSAIRDQCIDAPSGVERLPDPRFETILGVSVPVFDLWPLEPAAPAKIRRMLEHLGVPL